MFARAGWAAVFVAAIAVVSAGPGAAQSLGTVDAARREALARSASALAAAEVAFIPLHYQVVTWAMKRNLAYTARTDEFTFAHYFRPQ